MKKSPMKRSTKPMKRSRFKTKLPKANLDGKTKELQQYAWKRMSRYVRLRDLGKKCITCDTVFTDIKMVQAGHCFHDRSKGSPVSYDERNINGQCTNCNMWKNGMGVEYATALVEMYGPDVLSELSTLKHTTMKGKGKKEWLIGVIQDLDKKISELEEG